MSLSRQQLTLLGIFALFLGPVLLVMLMRSSWWQYQPAGLKNQGHLVQPPVQLSLEQIDDMDGKWLILYVLDQPCDQGCIENVTALRQIHRAAGRNGKHLGVALLGNTTTDSELRASLEAIYPEFRFPLDSGNTAPETLRNINMDLARDKADPDNIHTYILDPMRNVILAYQTDADPSDIHKDLKRLLKWSDQENR
jgi:hypothetical protein